MLPDIARPRHLPWGAHSALRSAIFQVSGVDPWTEGTWQYEPGPEPWLRWTHATGEAQWRPVSKENHGLSWLPAGSTDPVRVDTDLDPMHRPGVYLRRAGTRTWVVEDPEVGGLGSWPTADAAADVVDAYHRPDATRGSIRAARERASMG